MAAVSNSGDALYYASEELKRDKDVVLAAVSNDGTALEYASDDIKSNKEMVLVAVSQNGYALAYASKELKNDKEIVMRYLRDWYAKRMQTLAKYREEEAMEQILSKNFLMKKYNNKF